MYQGFVVELYIFINVLMSVTMEITLLLKFGVMHVSVDQSGKGISVTGRAGP
jgi:hypothetical protein